jgi:hypothetical protein
MQGPFIASVGIDPGQDLHKGGLAGAVFAADPMDLTPVNG